MSGTANASRLALRRLAADDPGVRSALVLVAAAVALTLVLPSSATSTAALSTACAVTAHAAHAPTRGLTTLSRSWWRKNRVWMGVAGAFHGEGFRAVPEGQKIAWYRDRRGALRLYGKRLDGPAATFETDIPSGYGTRYFQPSGITFGAPGCWAITAVVGTQASRFVVEVAPAS
jgi:hypothetical protein